MEIPTRDEGRQAGFSRTDCGSGFPPLPPLIAANLGFSARFVFVEENDPRGENVGSWDQTLQPTLEDSTACWHVRNSTFSYADGHVETHRWIDPVNITYALSMDPNKYYGGGPPTPTLTTCPHDLQYVFDDFATEDNP